PTDNRRIAGGVAAGERPRSPERRALVGGVPPPRIAVPDAAAGADPADPERRHLPDDPVRLVHRRITVAARPVGAAAGGVLRAVADVPGLRGRRAGAVAEAVQ